MFQGLATNTLILADAAKPKNSFWFMLFMIIATRYDGTMHGILMMLGIGLSRF